MPYTPSAVAFQATCGGVAWGVAASRRNRHCQAWPLPSPAVVALPPLYLTTGPVVPAACAGVTAVWGVPSSTARRSRTQPYRPAGGTVLLNAIAAPPPGGSARASVSSRGKVGRYIRHRQGKIKREHHSLPEAEPLLRALGAHPATGAVIPGPISRKKSRGEAGVRVGPSDGGHLAFAVHSPLYVQSIHAVVAPAQRERVLADLRAAGVIPAEVVPQPRKALRAASAAKPPAPPQPAGPQSMPVLPRIAVTEIREAAPSVGAEVLGLVQAALPALGYARGRFVYLPLGERMVAVEGARIAAAFPYRPPWVSAAAREDLAEEALGPAGAEAMILAAGLWGRTGDFVTQGWELVLDRGDLVGARRVAAP